MRLMKLTPFDDAAFVDVEAGDDAFGEHGSEIEQFKIEDRKIARGAA